MKGFDDPNYTQSPNTFFDEVLPLITSLAELKVTLTIIRQTFGWHVDEADLSYTKLEELTGLSRESVAEGVKLGMARGTIGRRESGNSFTYHLIVKNPDRSRKLTSQESRPVKSSDQPIVKNSDQTYKDKETEKENNSATQRKRRAQKPHKRDERQADPRTKYPAIQLVKQLTGYYPRLILYDKIIDTLGDHPDFHRARDCAVAWAGRGFRMDNFDWVFSWYVKGIPEAKNGNGTKQPSGGRRSYNERANAALDEIYGLGPDD